VQKLEDNIFLKGIEDDNNGYDMIISGTRYMGKLNNRNDVSNISNNYKEANNIQTNESVDKYQSLYGKEK